MNNKLPKLTRKQKAFADELLNNPKQSATRAALKHYGKPDRPTTFGTASVIATENLAKPNIMMYLHNNATRAEQTMVQVMDYSTDKGMDNPSYAAVAVSAAKDVLDRVHGRPTQKIETQSTVLQIGIDLTMLAPTDGDTSVQE